ncbi:catechol 2,3-dioxygenase-like lactoylglutathione lyase family enzyme [Shimia isoporae]|uniref:Catechol 2,3-dioxygenase-like lactoylglutathione lyase family enzyme n=1 Tax=Shimia isoporae TaxID=647720 RepID=A0A4R1NPF6_9RHOB|nr:VOC family protein [Shimia isoporae]TCL09729.1 catechol 2,3-dioxygenase-like lactoylglutathione lyase family enzyme [Shimia isoporae]
MTRHLHAVAIVVPDYDEALSFYVGKLGFVLREDRRVTSEKRWVVIAPDTRSQTTILLARAATCEQRAIVGRQFGGRVGLFLHTDDFARDHAAMLDGGVQFEESPRQEEYGLVAVWRDPFGNRWDLLQLT